MATFSAALLDRTYSTPDIADQRAQTRAAIAARSRERGLDIGCGPGLLVCELAMDVGPRGCVVGVDTSQDMIAMCAERARRDALSARTEFVQGDATDLRYPETSFDFVTVTQVYEYVPDLERALGEVFRVLKPQGRLAILDTDWESCVWHTEDRERTARILRAWERHFVHPHLPALLPGLLERAGFSLRSVTVVPILNLRLGENTYSAGMLDIISRYVVARGGIPLEDADRWSDDLRRQAARGHYFFNLSRYLFLAERPGTTPGGSP